MRSRAAAVATTNNSSSARKENRCCQHCGSSLLFIQRAFLNRHEKENAIQVAAEAAAAAAASRSASRKTTATTTTSMVMGRPMVTKCAYISFCACFGTYARLYTDGIGPASNLALQGSFLANSIGSFALGVLASSPDQDTTPDTVYAGLTVVSKCSARFISCGQRYALYTWCNARYIFSEGKTAVRFLTLT